ncbi:MAG: T9SS type A sorting domain-containing protein [Bacteroidetes bacterium]|nr:T9SS type A sorting domain-containing protein [Bacteroidota bacterium]
MVNGDNYFNIYPNPTDGIVNIDFSLKEGEVATLYIIDNNGATIAQNEMPTEKLQKLILNTSNLAKGVYLVRLVTNANRIEKKILTVQ